MEAIEKICPEIFRFMSLFTENMGKSIKKNQGIYIKNYMADIFTLKAKVKTSRISTIYEGKVIRTTSNNFTDKINTRESLMSLLANYIHSFDSQLLHLVVNDCRKENIRVSVRHDCFQVHSRNGDKLKNFYIKAYKKSILETEYDLEFFFKNNGVIITPEMEDFFQEIKMRKKKIISDMKNKKLFFSRNILSE